MKKIMILVGFVFSFPFLCLGQDKSCLADGKGQIFVSASLDTFSLERAQIRVFMSSRDTSSYPLRYIVTDASSLLPLNTKVMASESDVFSLMDDTFPLEKKYVVFIMGLNGCVDYISLEIGKDASSAFSVKSYN